MKKIAYKEMYENELTHAWYIATRLTMILFLKKYLKKKSKILDAGCGTGGTILYLKKRGYKNIIGVDKSQEAIRFCKKRNIKNIKLASVEKLPFKDNSFDAIYCLDVLYHKGLNYHIVIDEFRRVLKKNGYIYSQEPAYSWIKSNHDVAIETKVRFTKKLIKKTFQSSGFRVLRSTYFNSFFFIPMASKRILEKLKVDKNISSDVKPLPKFLNRLFLAVLSLESHLITHFSMPFGLSIIVIGKKL